MKARGVRQGPLGVQDIAELAAELDVLQRQAHHLVVEHGPRQHAQARPMETIILMVSR